MKRLLRALTWRLIAHRLTAKPPTRLVAIVVTASSRPELLPEERISLRHLHHFLGRYDKYLVAPRGLNLRLEGLQTVEFSPKYFGSVPAHNRLMYHAQLYRRFADYKYILMYHLDALALKDELLAWCDTDLDYIGSPWIPCPELPWVKEPAVGNGGFGLMKTAAMLRILYRRYERTPLDFWKDLVTTHLAKFDPVLSNPDTRSKWLGLGALLCRMWKVARRTEPNHLNFDMFLGFHAKAFFPEFQIVDWKTALRFSFEYAPRTCFELNNRQLPFGCHGWYKFDRAFWEQFLLANQDQPVSASMARATNSGLEKGN